MVRGAKSVAHWPLTDWRSVFGQFAEAAEPIQHLHPPFWTRRSPFEGQLHCLSVEARPRAPLCSSNTHTHIYILFSGTGLRQETHTAKSERRS